MLRSSPQTRVRVIFSNLTFSLNVLAVLLFVLYVKLLKNLRFCYALPHNTIYLARRFSLTPFLKTLAQIKNG
jgi:hypothetical protein